MVYIQREKKHLITSKNQHWSSKTTVQIRPRFNNRPLQFDLTTKILMAVNL